MWLVSTHENSEKNTFKERNCSGATRGRQQQSVPNPGRRRCVFSLELLLVSVGQMLTNTEENRFNYLCKMSVVA